MPLVLLVFSNNKWGKMLQREEILSWLAISYVMVTNDLAKHQIGVTGNELRQKYLKLAITYFEQMSPSDLQAFLKSNLPNVSIN